jgi:hypothetical protein
MSLETWKAEFYPVEASEVAVGLPAIEHSLRKWIGLRKENLVRHGLTNVRYCIGESDDKFLNINSNSCALCTHYIDQECSECPLVAVRGMTCDDDFDEVYAPYQTFGEKGDPEPMIALIQTALDAWKKEHPEGAIAETVK